MIRTFLRRASGVGRRDRRRDTPQQHSSRHGESSRPIAPPGSCALVRLTPFDIAAVLHLLSSRTSPLAGRIPLLPLETTLAILDLAEYWQPLHGALPAPTRVTDDEGEALHVLVPAFPTRSAPARMIRRIDIRIVSHDQGWSSWPEFRGTYESSCTWFELALLDERRAAASPRFWVGSNVHASSEWKEHRMVARRDHPLVSQARPGQHLAMFSRAECALWVNYVRELEVTVYLSWP